MVTVVDALNFLKDYGSPDSLNDRRSARDEADERCVVDLLIEQIEFADVIVINKTDLVTVEQRDQLEGILKALNPRARLVAASHGLTAMLDACLLTEEEMALGPEGWMVRFADPFMPWITAPEPGSEAVESETATVRN